MFKNTNCLKMYNIKFDVNTLPIQSIHQNSFNKLIEYILLQILPRNYFIDNTQVLDNIYE